MGSVESRFCSRLWYDCKTIKKRIKIITYPDFLYTVEGTVSSKKPRLTGRELQGKDSNGSGIRYFVRLLYL